MLETCSGQLFNDRPIQVGFPPNHKLHTFLQNNFGTGPGLGNTWMPEICLNPQKASALHNYTSMSIATSYHSSATLWPCNSAFSNTTQPIAAPSLVGFQWACDDGGSFVITIGALAVCILSNTLLRLVVIMCRTHFLLLHHLTTDKPHSCIASLKLHTVQLNGKLNTCQHWGTVDIGWNVSDAKWQPQQKQITHSLCPRIQCVSKYWSHMKGTTTVWNEHNHYAIALSCYSTKSGHEYLLRCLGSCVVFLNS